MLKSFRAVVVILIGGLAVSARAGITVTSYVTEAQANAYAPLDRSAYFATDERPNVSPAAASVSGDWTGTNVGGSDNTWHMVTSANISTTTSISTNSLNITADGGLSYNVNTTAGFIEPNRVATLYGIGADASYGCFFTIDAPAIYTLNAKLNGSSGVYFVSSQGSVIFQQQHFGTLSKTIAGSGVIPSGQYQISAGADQSGPSGLPAGVNQVI